MKTLFLIFSLFLFPFFSSAQSCNANFQYNLGNCPVVLFTDNSSGGSGFPNQATVTSWNWQFGDGSSSTFENPVHQYMANGTYNVCLIITDNGGCSDQFCTTIQITCIQQCEALFQYTAGTCPTIVFADNSVTGPTSQIVSWNWNFGDGTSGTGPNPQHQYTANGVYPVCLTIQSSNGCMDQYCSTVEINCIQQCEALFQYTAGLCPTIVFADNSTAGSGAQVVSWSWDFGDGTAGTGPNPLHGYQANGTYTVCLTIATSNGCVSDYCTTVEINCIAQCEALFQYTTGLCPTIVFADNSFAGVGAQIVSWSWDFGDGTTGTGPTQTHEYTANGAYTACLIIETSDGCTSDYCTTVEINCIQQCEALFQYTAGLCPTIVFADNSGTGSTSQIVSWSWDFGDGTSGTGPAQTHEYTANGIYTVCLNIVASDGCTDQYCSTVEIECIQQCEALFQYTAGLCPTIVFADNSGTGSTSQIVSWSWDFGDGTSGTGPAQTHEYTANGIYTVCLSIVASDGCADQYCSTVEIECIQQCEAFFQYTAGLCPTIVFADNSGTGSTSQIVSWSWDFGDGTTGTGPAQTHEYTANGIYTVCLNIVASDGCTDQYCSTVEIECLNGLGETDPQAFTLYPNPVTDYLTIDLLQTGSINYRIIGVNGVEYSNGDFKLSTSHTIDVQNLQKGIYLIEFEVNGQLSSKRFIKM